MKMSVEDQGFLPKSFYPRSQRLADKSTGKRPERRPKLRLFTNHAVGKIDVGCEFDKEVTGKPIT